MSDRFRNALEIHRRVIEQELDWLATNGKNGMTVEHYGAREAIAASERAIKHIRERMR